MNSHVDWRECFKMVRLMTIYFILININKCKKKNKWAMALTRVRWDGEG